MQCTMAADFEGRRWLCSIVQEQTESGLGLGGGASLKLPTTSASAYHTCTALFALLGEVVLPGGEPEGDVGNWVRSRSTRPKI